MPSEWETRKAIQLINHAKFCDFIGDTDLSIRPVEIQSGLSHVKESEDDLLDDALVVSRRDRI